jgi:CRISPR-associated protein Cas2
MFVVVSYDIPNDKRRTKVMKLLKNYGNHVQYSVFECDVKREVFLVLRARLGKLLAPKEDNVRFYFLDADAVAKIECVGLVPVELAQPYYFIKAAE